MTLETLTEKITKCASAPWEERIDNLLCFFGPEIEIMRIYTSKVAECMGQQIVYMPTVADAVQKLKTRSLTKKPTCYVVMQDMDIQKEENAVDKLLENLAGDQKNTLILQYDALDKRRSFYKDIDAVEFPLLSERVLIQYVLAQIDLSEEYARKLIAVCGSSYRRILLEIDKIKAFASAYGTEDYDKVYRTLVSEGCIHTSAMDRIFELIDALCMRDVETSCSLFYTLREQGEAPLKILSLLQTAFNTMLRISTTEMGKGAAERTGLSPWQISKYKEKAAQWEEWELEHMHKLVQDLESGVKNGKYEDTFAVELVLCEILK